MNNLTPKILSNLPLSSNQKRLWIISQQDKLNPAYNLSLSYHFKGIINYEVLNKSMNILFNRQHTLFSVFRLKDGIPYIDIVPIDVTIGFIDFFKFPVETRKESIFSFIKEDTRKCFDIEIGPLYRIYLLKEDDNNYFFHVTIHHLIFDGWSMRLFSEELSKIYTDLAKGRYGDLKHLLFHSYDFAEMEESLLTEDDKKESIQFWKENLKGCNSELKIVYDYPRKKISTGLGGREFLCISESVTKKLKILSTEVNSTLFKTMLSVLGILFQKYTGENDICIGFPISRRRLNPALDGIFGFFVGTSLVRFNKETSCNFREYIVYATEVINKAIVNSRLPFDKIVEVVNPDRSNINPLFQISLTWWNDFYTSLSFDGIIGERFSISEGVSAEDISFYLWEEDNLIRGEIEYNIDVFKQDTIIRLKNHFLKFIENLCENPDRNLNSISLILESELKLISEINNTDTDYPKDKTIAQLFEEQAALYPSKTAVAFKNSSITFKQLNERANQLARILRKLGIIANAPVGILVDRSIDMIVGMLGILKAGGAYVPLDKEYPEQRKKFIIRDSGCKILITQDKYLTETFEGLEKLSLDSETSYDFNKTNIESINDSSDLAYILYTSGTTGVPKGTLIPQKGVVRLVCKTNYVDFTPEDKVLQSTSIVFDASTVGIFGSLLNGATLYIVDKETVLDPSALGNEFEKNNITITDFPTPLFIQIAELRTDIFRKLKTLLVGGDVLSVSHVNKLRKDNPQITVINEYGPTENSCNSTAFIIDRDFDYKIPIGKPISNSTAYIFDKYLNYQPIGVLGELYVGGEGLSKGYLNREDLNKACFVDNPHKPGERLYKTGDFARWLADGNIEFFGRIDNQIKIRGFRVELEEIEAAIYNFPHIKNCAVKVSGHETSNMQIIGYIVSDEANKSNVVNDLKIFLSNKLPAYMVPAKFVVLSEMPLTPGGKIDRKALPEPEILFEKIIDGSLTGVEEVLIKVWKEILQIDSIGLNTNFFEAGGSSILVPRIISNLYNNYKISIKSIHIFEYPTIKMLADFISLNNRNSEINIPGNTKNNLELESRDIAIIGMAGCFPGADNIEIFWDIIKNGTNVISYFSREELERKGIPEELLDSPNYVYANSLIGRSGMFEPSFFDITPREADFMDPQHRLFLEICYEALEDAGYAPRIMSRNIGVFAGAGVNNYFFKSLLQNPEEIRSIGEFQCIVNNEKDFLATRVSYKLNLTGPSLDIQTGCSTSLVAVHAACKSLLDYECDMALGGGVSLQFPNDHGYMQQKGSILSPSGFCRPFDVNADGTIVGEGAAVILLKRLDDAVKDKDHIYAVIKSTAVNNDGSVKVSYMAPSLEGQTKVIQKALKIAGISPESIAFVETHGTGTKLGDPIEIGALKKVFPVSADNQPYCALGAVKANIGHLDAASGVTGVIKVILAMKNKQIPPMTNFNSYNPELEIEGSPFYITTKLKAWESDKKPRRAGVSSFGIGGTNAHCIIEEWNQVENKKEQESGYYLLPISAKNQNSLDILNEKYISFFDNTELNINDIAYTLYHGREFFKFREIFATKNFKEKGSTINNKGVQLFDKPVIAFMFTGQGSQYFSMSKGLYDNFLIFKTYIDSANDILKRECKIDLLDLLYSLDEQGNINETIYAQPALVAVQYAIVKLLEEFGITPDVLIGHSIGEITAAGVSGVISFRDMIFIASKRGEIMQKQQRGSMLAVSLSEDELKQTLISGIEISLINAPNFCVVSGTENDIISFQRKLIDNYPGLQTTILKTSHAFHSYLMDPAIVPFKTFIEKISFHDISIPFVSNTTGALISNKEAKSSKYWSDHIRNSVNFSSGINTLLNKQTLFLEVGPGNMLTALLSQFKSEIGFKAIPTMRGAKQEADDVNYFLNAISQFWIIGGKIDWSVFHKVPGNKVSLPTYTFNRKKHLLETKSVFSFDYSSGDQLMVSMPSDKEVNLDTAAIDRTNFIEKFIEPNTEVQKILIKIWEEYLGIKNIGIIDDFFSLGGHSLLASQVINKVNEHFKIDLPIDSLFKTSTIEKLEKLLDRAKRITPISFNLPMIEKSEYLPVSIEQVRLWMLTQIDNNPAYNIPFTYKFKGKFHEEIFCKSINAVFDRHEILRSRIVTVDIDPAMIIDKKGQVIVQHLDYSLIPEHEREKHIQEFISEDIRKIFDIENDPLYRIYLIKTDSDEVIFHMTIHHIIFDGWSWGIFVRDLKKAYSDLLQNNDILFHDNIHQYYEYAQWQNTNISDNKYDKSIKYWKENLNRCNSQLNFPYDFQRKDEHTGFGENEHFRIDPNVHTEIRSLAKSLNITDFVIYVSAFSILLNKYSKDEDLCIGISSANRPNYQLEKIIGFFVNTLVLRFKINEKDSFKEYLTRTKKIIIDALEHQEIPFDKLVEALQPQRRINANPIYQVLFAWLNTPSEIFEFQNVCTEKYFVKKSVAHLDITIYMWEEKGRIEGEVGYNTDILSSDTIHSLINNYLKLLEDISKNFQITIKELGIS